MTGVTLEAMKPLRRLVAIPVSVVLLLALALSQKYHLGEYAPGS